MDLNSDTEKSKNISEEKTELSESEVNNQEEPKVTDFLVKKESDGTTSVELDKRKTVSPFNSAKHLKYAKKGISAFCNTCKYRDIEAGGRGGCPKYKEDSVCTIRNDTKKLCNELDTRNPETIEWMLDKIIKEGFESVMLSYAQAKIDGNIPDKNSRAEIDSFVKRLQLWNELRTKTTLKAVKTESLGSDGEIQSIFQMLELSRKGGGSSNG